MVVSFALAGCATPGPLHVYSLPAGGVVVHDVAPLQPDTVRDVPSFLAAGETITGFAYDPFTDHFFIRLAPGNRVRVVDRPARAVKREVLLEGVPTHGGGDLAVSPRDGHLFLLDSAGTHVIETTRFGKAVGRIALPGRRTPAVAITYDPVERWLAVLDGDSRTIERFDLAGHRVGAAVLEKPVLPSLGFDPERREYYAPLANGTRDGQVGVFDERGACVRVVDTAGGEFVDVGPHSFLRMF